METEFIKEIELKLSEYESLRNFVANDIFKILKKNSKTYRDVENNTELLFKNFLYSIDDKEKYESLLRKVQQLLEEEKSDLPIANHFQHPINFQ